MTITPTQLTAWRELAEKATPGEWQDVDGELLNNGEWGRYTLQAYQKVPTPEMVARFRNDADPAFIAASRVAVPALIEEVERLQSHLTGAVAELSIAREEVTTLQGERDALRNAAKLARDYEGPEWIEDSGEQGHWYFCPGCGNILEQGHSSDCKRAPVVAALDVALGDQLVTGNQEEPR